jgi:molybdopterin-biosynthesis enzyme MoeA-like protein
MSDKQPAVVTVGDELLYGERDNNNQQWMLQRLQSLGQPARFAISLPDSVTAISEGLRWLQSQSCQPIFVSGGIGATHDDLTREGIAAALDRPLTLHAECNEILSNRYGVEFNERRQRMAMLPEGCDLIDNPLGAPGFHCDGVYAFPGFPNMLQPMLESLLPNLFVGVTQAWLQHDAVLPIQEGIIAADLEQFAQQHPQIKVGIYPSTEKFRQELTIRLRYTAADAACLTAFEAMLDNYR